MTHETFNDLFRKHWDSATGLEVTQRIKNKTWWNKEFVAAMDRCGCMITDDAIYGWLKGARPRRAQLVAILDVFFGSYQAIKGVEHPDRNLMMAAWQDEERPKKRKSATALQPGHPENEKASDWPRHSMPPITDFAELEIYTPVRDNERDGYRVRGRLVLGEREDDSMERPIAISVQEAFLTFVTSGAVVTDGTLIAVAEPHPNLQQAAGGLRVVGPSAVSKVSDAKFIDGEVFAGRDIAVIAGDLDNSASVTLELSARPRDINVTAIDDNGAALPSLPQSIAKQAVLSAVLASSVKKADAGRIILQRVHMSRRPPA
jgi:hypothetical protein